MKHKKVFLKSINDILNTETFKWIMINGKHTNYLLSSFGKVYSTNYYGKTNKFCRIKERKSSNGYYNVTIHHKGKSYTFLTHIIVASYFIPNPDNLPTVNHIDGDKSNNKVSNLEWMSSKDNSIHAANNGLLPTGEKSRLARISNKTANKICQEFVLNRLTFNEICGKYNTTYNTVYDIYRRKSWKQISIRYDFSNYTRDSRYNEKHK